MIEIKDVLEIHSILIERFGGSKGIRDFALLDSALQRAYSTFDASELYPLPIDKAAATIESIIINHPFIDGNKRIGYTLMRLILLNYGFDVIATEDEKYEFVINIAEGKLKFEGIKKWLKTKLIQIS